MHQPSLWWTGLIPVALLWVVGAAYKTGSIEADLHGKAAAAVAAALPDSGGAVVVSGAGRDIALDGLAFAPGDAAKAKDAVENAEGVRYATVALKSVAAVRPYAFSATRSGNRLVLEGSAPLPGVRVKLIDAAKSAIPGAEIVDNLAYAIGAPEGFEAIAARGVADAARLENGVFALSDKAYSIAGVAASSGVYEAAIAATQQLPAGATLAKADIQPPEAKPYAWSATSDGVAAMISGVAPSIEARAAILKAASASLPGKMVVDQMQIARGAPSGDYVAAVGFALAELSGLSNGRVSLSDGALSVVGETATSQAYEAAVAAVKSLPAGMSLARADILAPETKPYVWGASNDGKTIALTGLAPSAAAREAIAAAAAKAMPGKSVDNQMGIARGAPAGDFAAGAGFAVSQLALMSSGKVGLTDNALTISGEAAAPAAFDALNAAVKKLPEGMTLARADIQPPEVKPYVFMVEKTDGRATLSGYAPDDKTRRDIEAAAKSAFFNDEVVDDLKIGKGAPANFVNGAKAGLPQFARMATGTLSLSDGDIAVKGAAIYEKAADQIKRSLETAAPQGFKISVADIAVAPPGEPLSATDCQPRFEGLLSKGHVEFETGNANLSKDSLAILDNLVGVARRCLAVDIDVAGHTDSVGAAESNLELSRRRAEAVVAFLKDAGVDVGRISSVGYGETRPIAPNDTADGRARNRRIEFSVK